MLSNTYTAMKRTSKGKPPRRFRLHADVKEGGYGTETQYGPVY
jgi:hypothetical protein